MRKFLAACMAIVMIFTIAGCSSEGHEGEAKTPSGSSIQKGKDYQKVVDEFESSGFTNIKLEKLDDLVTGWLTKDGEVESVSVDGDTGYSADTWYPADAEVVITYHTFPEKETSETDSEFVSTEEPAVDILTVDNSPELAAILLLKQILTNLMPILQRLIRTRLLSLMAALHILQTTITTTLDMIC